MRAYSLYIFDLDGTLFRGDEAIPGAAEAVERLRDGSMVRFLTNNSSTTRRDYVAKLRRLGFAAEEGEVYSSATGSAARLRELGLRTAFVTGEPGLVWTLQEAGIEVVNRGEGDAVTTTVAPAEALLVGMCRSFSYGLLDAAMQVGLQGARFFATNADKTFPLEQGRLAPGAGTIVAAVAACLGREPEVFGKPQPYLVELILQESGVAAKETLVIGDRYETDILAGQAAGCDTLLVLSGIDQPVPDGQWALGSVAELA